MKFESSAKLGKVTIIAIVSLVVLIFQNIVLLPVMLSVLPENDVGVWLFWGIGASISMLADFGLRPTLARYYVASKFGGSGSISYIPFCILKRLSNYVYIVLAFISFILAFSLFYFFGNKLIVDSSNPKLIFDSCVVYSLSLALIVYAMKYRSMLQGCGYQGIDKNVELLFNIFRLIVVYFIAITTKNLYSVSYAYLISSLFLIVTLMLIVKKIENNGVIDDNVKNSNKNFNCLGRGIIKEFCSVSTKTSLLQIFSFLTLNMVSIFAAQSDDNSKAVTIMLTVRLFAVIQQVSLLPVSIFSPKISKLWIENNISSLRNTLCTFVSLSLLFYLFSSLFVLFFGNSILYLIGTTHKIITGYLAAVILIMYLLEIHHVIHATILMQSNEVPFVKMSLISIIILFSLLSFNQFGIIGVFAAQFISQLLTNNWYPVYLLLEKLNLSYKEYVLTVILSCSKRKLSTWINEKL